MRNDLKLAAFSIQRRSVAVAIFVGTHLGFTDSKQLTSDHEKAKASAVGFVNWIIESFEIQSVVLEALHGSKDMMRSGTYQAVEATLRSQGVSIDTVTTENFLNAFVHAGRVRRNEVREIVARIWPIIGDPSRHPCKFDAAALGLYYQTDRLLQ
jgi:hypothetical protein